VFDQAYAAELAAEPELVLLCGRYEGIDERLLASEVDAEVSIGDYVLSGGEPAAMVMVDAIARLLEGALAVLKSGDHKAIAQWRRQQALGRTALRRPELLEQLELNSEDRRLLAEFSDQPLDG